VTAGPTRLVIDDPDQSSIVSDAVRVRGWALVDRLPVLPTVRLGKDPVPCRFWPDWRPDVAALIDGDQREPHGYLGWLDLARLPAGPLVLTVRAGAAEHELRVDHRPCGVRITVERPRGRRPMLGRIAVSGWVHTTGVQHELVRVEGPDIGLSGLIDVIRPDVARVTGAPLACGFDVIGALPADPPGRISLAVIASDRTGGKVVSFVDCLVAHMAEPRLVIEELQLRPGAIAVTGYVVWPPPAPAAARVVLSVDGRHAGQAPATESRPDLFWSHDAEPATLRCGFHVCGLELPSDAAGAVVTVQANDGRIATAQLSLAPGAARDLSSRGVRSALTAVVGTGAVVLDCCDGLDGLGLERCYQIVKPLLETGELPYVNDSFDIVVAARARPVSVAEAQRVAREAVLVLGGDEPELHRLRPARRRASVSVVMAVYGAADITDRAIGAVLASTPDELDLELIVVDDCDPSGAAARLDAWADRDPRVRSLHLHENVGYLRATNAGTAEARNDIVVLLNNDCVVAPGTLAVLLDTLAAFPRVGAVGGKLLYPDGRLQEAGGIVFGDGTGQLLGMRSATPDDPLFSFVRPVDYCSAALLALTRALWEQLGGFDEVYAPAYYEDTDLCLRLRATGRAVLYQPAALATHYLGTVTGRGGIERGRRTFVERWADELAGHPAPPELEDLSTWRSLAYDAIERSPPWRTP
jgi:GT2 family glycosyltransferase